VAETVDYTLKTLRGDSVLYLRCMSGEGDVPISIPERWKITGARLKFGFINSSTLLEDSSQLVVSFNGAPLAQTKLYPKDPEGKMNIAIPPNRFLEGYNRITFIANQHFTRDCEFPCAPELWTTIGLEDAVLTLEYSLKPVPLQLSKAPGFLFDSKMQFGGEVNIVTDGYTTDILTLAGIVTSGVAKRFDYRKVLFTTSKDIRRGYDNIIIGDKKFVEDFLAKHEVEGVTINNSLIQVVPLPPDEALMSATLREPGKKLDDATHALLIVSGANTNQIRLAAETLANLTFPYPGTSEMTPLEFKSADTAAFTGKRMLLSNRVTKFKALGFTTHTSIGFNSSVTGISFGIPLDFVSRGDQPVRLSINYTYGAGLRPDSLLNITLNGVHVRSINLDKAAGELVEGYKLDIPTDLFKPGLNDLRLIPVLTPQGDLCEWIRPEGLFLTIFENSTIHFPRTSHMVNMPSLTLFTFNGFPITRWLDGAESALYITSPKKELVDASLNMIGLITQNNGYPLTKLKVTLEQPNGWDGEILVIGDTGSIPPGLFKDAPLALVVPTDVSYPVLREWNDVEKYAKSKQKSGLGPQVGLLMESESPLIPGRSTIIMTAVSAEDVLALSYALMDWNVYSKLKGDLALVQLTPPLYKVDTAMVGKAYFVSKSGKFDWNEYILAIAYEYRYLFFAVAFILMAVLMYAFMKTRGRRRRAVVGVKAVESTGVTAKEKRGIFVGALFFLAGLIFKGKPSKKVEVAPAAKKPEAPAKDNKNIAAPDRSQDLAIDQVKRFQLKTNDYFSGDPKKIRVGIQLNQLVDKLSKIEGFDPATLGTHLDNTGNPFEALIKTINEFATTAEGHQVKDIQGLLDSIRAKPQD
jgi:hypothetical protein